jgi:ribonuclease J
MAFLGRSVQVHALAARRTGHLTFPEEVVIAKERMSELHRPSVLGIATGTQGEPQAALARLARGDHPDFALQAGDTVILSSRVIPGAERDVQDIVSNLLRLGVQLYWPRNQHGLHVSGHACQDEQRKMIELCAPQAFVPVHGALSHLHGHAKLARTMGISSVCVLENGQSAALAAGSMQRDQDFVSGRVHIWGGKEVTPSVLGERRALAHDGSAFVHVTVDTRLGILSFALRTRGVAPAYHHAALERDAQQESAAALAGLPEPHTDERVIEAVRLATRRALQRVTSRKPITTVALGPRNGSPS